MVLVVEAMMEADMPGGIKDDPVFPSETGATREHQHQRGLLLTQTITSSTIPLKRKEGVIAFQGWLFSLLIHGRREEKRKEKKRRNEKRNLMKEREKLTEISRLLEHTTCSA